MRHPRLGGRAGIHNLLCVFHTSKLMLPGQCKSSAHGQQARLAWRAGGRHSLARGQAGGRHRPSGRHGPTGPAGRHVPSRGRQARPSGQVAHAACRGGMQGFAGGGWAACLHGLADRRQVPPIGQAAYTAWLAGGGHGPTGKRHARTARRAGSRCGRSGGRHTQLSGQAAGTTQRPAHTARRASSGNCSAVRRHARPISQLAHTAWRAAGGRLGPAGRMQARPSGEATRTA